MATTHPLAAFCELANAFVDKQVASRSKVRSEPLQCLAARGMHAVPPTSFAVRGPHPLTLPHCLALQGGTYVPPALAHPSKLEHLYGCSSCSFSEVGPRNISAARVSASANPLPATWLFESQIMCSSGCHFAVELVWSSNQGLCQQLQSPQAPAVHGGTGRVLHASQLVVQHAAKRGLTPTSIINSSSGTAPAVPCMPTLELFACPAAAMQACTSLSRTPLYLSHPSASTNTHTPTLIVHQPITQPPTQLSARGCTPRATPRRSYPTDVLL